MKRKTQHMRVPLPSRGRSLPACAPAALELLQLSRCRAGAAQRSTRTRTRDMQGMTHLAVSCSLRRWPLHSCPSSNRRSTAHTIDEDMTASCPSEGTAAAPALFPLPLCAPRSSSYTCWTRHSRKRPVDLAAKSSNCDCCERPALLGTTQHQHSTIYNTNDTRPARAHRRVRGTRLHHAFIMAGLAREQSRALGRWRPETSSRSIVSRKFKKAISFALERERREA